MSDTTQAETQAQTIETFVDRRGGTLKPTQLDLALLAGAAALRAQVEVVKELEAVKLSVRKLLDCVLDEANADYQMGERMALNRMLIHLDDRLTVIEAQE